MGFNLNDYVAQDYMNKEDLKHSNKWAVLDVTKQEFDEGNGKKKERPQLYLEANGVVKKLTLNTTNTKRLINVFSDSKNGSIGNVDSDKLIGKVIYFKTVETEYGGKPIEAIRVDEENTKKTNI